MLAIFVQFITACEFRVHMKTATQRAKLSENECQLTNEIYKVYHESRYTAGHVRRDLLFLVRKHVDGKRYQNIYFCDR